MKKKGKYLVSPNVADKSLTKNISGFDENLKPLKTTVIHEKSLTIFLNNQVIRHQHHEVIRFYKIFTF